MSCPNPQAQERRVQLRDFIAALPDKRIQMARFQVRVNEEGRYRSLDPKDGMGGCGTVGCIAGWSKFLFDDRQGISPNDHSEGLVYWGSMLGLTYKDYTLLFRPPGWRVRGRYPKKRVLGVLDNLIETGRVEWPAPEEDS